MSWVKAFTARLARMILLLFLVLIASSALVRYGPGYLSDAREMDPRFADRARADLAAEESRSGSFVSLIRRETLARLHGELGTSRQYGVPVLELIRPRLAVTTKLMLEGVALAWTLAFSGALLASARCRPSPLWNLPATVLLAMPTAVVATLCMLTEGLGPVLVMGLLLAARDFKFLHRILLQAWSEPHVLQARAQGIRWPRLAGTYVLRRVRPQFLALVTLSLVTALSAVVPVEVIFSVPGLGELAWSAALNRDLPVLLSMTALMALAVTAAGLLSEGPAEWKTA
jgi:peptide/nickel transport system permease protein